MSTNSEEFKDFGVLAEFENVTDIVRTCEKVRDGGYTSWDSYSPFPIHGIDPAMGIKPTKLPWLIFCMGITGTFTGLCLQYYMNAYDYQYMLSGKPIFSLPANVPVMFELTILFAALTTFFSTLIVNGLPSFYNPLFKVKEFARATDDRYFICIEAADPRYDAAGLKKFFSENKAISVQVVEDDSHVGAAIPEFIKNAAAAGFVAGLIPLAIIAYARVVPKEMPRIHPNPNMDFQKKFKTQTENTIFKDGRAMRYAVAGTIAEGELNQDDHFYRGVVDGQWADTFPKDIVVTAGLLEQGQKNFDISCSPCHGSAGYGDGMVHRKVQSEADEHPTWVAPSSLHQDHVRSQPHGKIFNTITNGIRNMQGYGHALPEADRWAIVAYIRALQRSQYAKLDDVESDKRSQLQ
jgi:mono/diheme cytochrome c family protein